MNNQPNNFNEQQLGGKPTIFTPLMNGLGSSYYVFK